MDGLNSCYLQGYRAGSRLSAKALAERMANPDKESLSNIAEIGNILELRKNRRDIVDFITLSSCDLAEASSIKLAEMGRKLDKMDKKLNLLCQKFDVEA